MASLYSINLFHVLFVGPLLILIGLYHNHPSFPEFIWQLLVILGIGVMIYQAWIAYSKYKLLSGK
jgi:hypothetical protein